MVLGPVAVDVGGGRSAALQRKQLELLALLLMEPNRARPSDVLIDRLWNGEPPPTATTAIRVHLSAVRAALRMPGSGVSRLGRTPFGYVVTVEDGELDVQRFEAEVRAAQARDDDESIDDICHLRRALGLWRGIPFEDLDDLDGVTALRRHLIARRLHAVTMLATALRREARHEELASAAVSWLEEFPTSEQIAGELVLALYRSGDQIGALHAWRGFAERLVDEYGIDPTPDFVELEGRILRQADDWARAPRHRSHDDVIARSQFEALTLVERDDLTTGIVRVVTSDVARQPAIALVVGEAGIGKTAVLQHICDRLRSRVVVTARQNAPPLGLVSELLGVLGAPSPSVPASTAGAYGQLTAQLSAALERSGPPAVLVDDIDRCDPDSIEVLRRVLMTQSSPWVVTSRSADLGRHPLLQDRAALARSRTFELTPLTRVGVRDLAAVHGLEADGDLLDEVEAATGGNPFLIVAVARSSAAGEPLGRVPAQAAEHVRRLVGELGSDGRSWLEHAALDAAPAIDLDVVARAARIDHDRSLEIAESALALGLLADRNGGLTFRHALVRDGVLAQLTTPARRRLHGALAMAMMDDPLPPEPSRIARHLRGSGAPALARAAAEATAEEAEEALRTGAVFAAAEGFGEAAALGARAGVAHPTTLRWRLRRCDALVAAAKLDDAKREAHACATDARRLGERGLFVESATRAVGPIIPTGPLRDVAEALVMEALDWSSAEGRRASVGLCEAAARLFVIDAGPTSDRLRGEIASTLERAAEDLSEPASQALAALGLRSLTWSAGRPQRARTALSTRALRAARRSGDPDLQLRAQRALVNDLFSDADPATRTALLRYADEAAEAGSPFHGWFAARLEASWLHARGDDAAAATRRAADFESAVDDETRAAAIVAEVAAQHVLTRRLRVLGGLRGESGEVDSTVAPTAELGWLAVAADGGSAVDVPEVTRAFVRAAHGPLRAAAAAFAVLALAPAAELRSRRSTARSSARTSLLESIAGWLRPLSGGLVLLDGGIGCLGPVDAYLACCEELLGDRDAAEYHRRVAHEVAERVVPAWLGWHPGRER